MRIVHELECFGCEKGGSKGGVADGTMRHVRFIEMRKARTNLYLAFYRYKWEWLLSVNLFYLREWSKVYVCIRFN